MKKLFLFLMIILPTVMVAQKESNLAVSPGTVTFDVEWDKADLPALWSDTMWVFVDYNKNGKMTRMLISGGTLTAHSANTLTPQSPDVGSVIKLADNDKGAWVVGDTRSAGSFSATVQLLTATADLAGACAYASSYPPVAKYVSPSEIAFAGTPIYEIKLEHTDGVETVEAGSTLLLPCGYRMSSFTDATGAPGVFDFNCTPGVISGREE
jgi:hypothetical protein